MDLRHLRYFVAVAEEGSLTRAAERLWIAQPGLSQQMLALERELDVQLLRRRARGVDLTDAGRRFLDKARVALDAAEDARAVAEDARAGAVGTLRLGVDWRSGQDVMPALERRFRAARPRVDLVLLQAQSDTLDDYLTDRLIDAAIVRGAHAGDARAGLLLARTPVGIGMARRHPLAGHDVVSAQDLHGQRFVVSGDRGERTHDAFVRRALGALGLDRPRLVPGGYGASLSRLVREEGLLMLESSPLPHFAADLVLKPIVPTLHHEVHLVWNRGRMPGPLRALVDLCVDPSAPEVGVAA